MTFEESNTIFELSVTADQTRDVLGLLIERYFQTARMDDTERWDFVNGHEQMCNVLSLVEHQVHTIARTLDDLAGISPVSGESA